MSVTAWLRGSPARGESDGAVNRGGTGGPPIPTLGRGIALGLLIFVPGIVWWIAFFPATMSPDSIAVWDAVHEGRPLNIMPYAYWLYVYILSFGGNLLGLVSLVQVVGLSLSLFYVARSLGLRYAAASAVVGAIMASPFGGLFAVALWKDVPTVILVLAGSGALACWVRSSGKRLELLLGLLLLFVAGLLRFESPWLVLVAGGLLAIFSFLDRSPMRARGRRTAGWVILIALASLLVSSLLQSTLVGKGLPSWNKWIPAIADLAYVAAMEPRHQSAALVATRQMISGDALTAAADCTLNATMFYSRGFDASLADAWQENIFKWWVETAVTFPHLVAEAHLCRGAAYLPPPLASDAGPYPNWNGTSIEPNDFGVSFAMPLAVRTPLVFWYSIWASKANIIAWPGLLVLLGTLALAAIGRWRRERGPRLVLAATMWGTLLPFAAWTVFSDYRYVASAQLIGLVALSTYLAGLVSSGAFVEPPEKDRSATTTNSP